METLEQTIPDTRTSISQKFDQLVGEFENQLKKTIMQFSQFENIAILIYSKKMEDVFSLKGE